MTRLHTNTDAELETTLQAELDELGSGISELLRAIPVAYHHVKSLYDQTQRQKALRNFTVTASLELIDAMSLVRGYADVLKKRMMSLDAEATTSAMTHALDRATRILRQVLVLHLDPTKRREEDFTIDGDVQVVNALTKSTTESRQ